MTSNIIEILSSVRSFRLIENDKCGNTIENVQGSTHLIKVIKLSHKYFVIYYFAYLGNLCDFGFIGFFILFYRNEWNECLMEFYEVLINWLYRFLIIVYWL